MGATCISSICFKKNYNLHAKFMILMFFNVFSFFFLYRNVFIIIIYTWPIYTIFFFIFFCIFFFTFFLEIYSTQIKKMVFIVAIATLFYFLAMLKISLRSYIFFVDVYNLYYL
jgi:hypothetical protein